MSDDAVGDVPERIGERHLHQRQQLLHEEIEVVVDGRINYIAEHLFAAEQIVENQRAPVHGDLESKLVDVNPLYALFVYEKFTLESDRSWKVS